MLSLSTDHNPRYVAEVVTLSILNEHKNADKLQVATIYSESVIVGTDCKLGDIGVFFPVESQISQSFLSSGNMYSDSSMNSDSEQKGYFGKRGRVKATKLRGEKSFGMFVPIKSFCDITGIDIELFDNGAIYESGTQFDTMGEELLVKKYEIQKKEGQGKSSQGQKPLVSRLIDGQFHLHVDTENLRRNAYQLQLSDVVTVSYKLHGTSAVFANCLVKKKMNLLEKSLKWLGVNIDEKEYDIVYSSRKVVKNKGYQPKQNSYYKTDHRGEMAEEIGCLLPKGYAFYGEIVGYGSNGERIQKDYDYGCMPGQKEFYCYRVTFTNEDGLVNNISTRDAKMLCTKHGINFVDVFYTGSVLELLATMNLSISEHRQENLIKELELKYNEKDCYMCTNKVPEEGIVLRVERPDIFQAYKLKADAFRLKETETLDFEEAGQDLLQEKTTQDISTT